MGVVCDRVTICTSLCEFSGVVAQRTGRTRERGAPVAFKRARSIAVEADSAMSGFCNAMGRVFTLPIILDSFVAGC